MTAYPEKLSVEAMFCQDPVVPPPSDADRPSSPPPPVEGPWRVVSADGTTSVCHPAEAAEGCEAPSETQTPPDDPQTEAAEMAQQLWPVGEEPWRQLDAIAETVAAYTEAFADNPPRSPSTTPKSSTADSRISMPIAATDSSDVFGPQGQTSQGRILRNGQSTSPRKLGAAAVVSGEAAKRRQNSAPPSQVLDLLGPSISRSHALPSQSSRCREIDSQLARVIENWPKLPRNLQVAILAMIEATKDGRC